LGVATIVPDGSGWDICQKRLGDETVAFLRDEIPNPFVKGYGATAWAHLKNELTGPHHDVLGSGMRYCADMVYSGHTYFTCLYALGLLELVRCQLVKRGVSFKDLDVEASCFHCSMDILVAVLIKLL